jgi:DNA-binding winged helix-turn-helix (wHTH) protein/Tfp pilus assembly protein PilF
MDLSAGQSVRFGPFRLDVADGLLYRGDELIRLPPKVTQTLLILVERHGHVVSKNELMRRLWPDTFVEEGTLTQYVSLLRKALGEHGLWIQNHPRRGYQFTGPIEPAERTASQLQVDAPAVGVAGRRRFLVVLSIAAAAIGTWTASRFFHSKPPLPQGEAYRLLARARALTATMTTPADLRDVEQVLEQAVAADPSLADAYGLLSYIHVRRYNAALAGKESLRSAVTYANQALAKDPRSPTAMRALVDVHHLSGRSIEALVLARAALEADPEGVDTIAAAAEAYFRNGLYERAIPLYQKALAAEPENRAFRGQSVRMHLFLNDQANGLDLISSLPPSAVGQWGMLLFAEAGMMDRAMEVARTDPQTQLVGLFGFFRGCVLAEGGDQAAAIEIWRKGIELAEPRSREYDNALLHQWLSLRYAKLGDREKALQHMESSLAVDPGNPVQLFLAAETDSLLGNREAAIRKLQAAANGGFTNVPMARHLAGRMYAFYGIRDDPAFLAVLAQMDEGLSSLRTRF